MFPVMSDERIALLAHHRPTPSYTSLSSPHVHLDVVGDDPRHRSPHDAAIPPSFQSSEALMSPLPPLPPPPLPPASWQSSPSPQSWFCDCCGGGCMRVSGWMGSPQFIFVTVLLYFLAHFAVCLWSLVVYWDEVCQFEYHHLLCVWMVRDLLGIRILHWQTHAQATEPSTFDRFLKNWMDMIVFIYAGMWALAPRDCIAAAPHHFWLCTALVCLSYASLILRGLLYLAMQHMRGWMGDCTFIFVRSLSKWLNGGAAFTGALLREVDVLVMSEMEGVKMVRFERGMWDEEDCMCVVCLDDYEEGENIRVLGCGHHMHARCVDQWLMVRRKCCVCRKVVEPRGRG